MPDITMCANESCERKNNCYRAMAKPSEYQSWSDFYEDCASNDFRNQWKMKRNSIFVDEISDMLCRC